MMRGALLAELARESPVTRRVLARVPEERLPWKPHPKSMSLGALALHVAIIPGAVTEFVSEAARELPSFLAPEATSKAQILEALEHSITSARARLETWTEADLRAEWRMTRAGATLFALPRIDLLRSLMLNHWYHHRGELLVYLRLLDVPVPAVYGPTADENPFLTQG
jgi:uncharacterized damage-inducible protein DinB